MNSRKRFFAAANGKVDVVLTGDDFGSQNAPLVSPAMWEEFFGDGFREYVAIAKRHGAKVMHHSCGAIRPIIPLMVERGLDILQSIQPEAAQMDGGELKAEFGDRLCFHGGMSIQRTLPFGTPDEIRAEVKNRVANLGFNGGYILCTSHNIQADTPVDNVRVMLDAYHEFG